jgi:alanine racemase
MTDHASIPSSVRARLTVDLSALAANWRLVADLVSPARAGVAIKANAYGLGQGPAADALWQEGCRDFFVATLAEADSLRTSQPQARIHLLNGIFATDVDACLALSVQPILNDLAQIALWRTHGRGQPCSIMVDTGINRLGLPVDGVSADALEGLTIDILMSHLACADDPEHPLNERQRQSFDQLAGCIPAARRSLANSAGVLLGPAYWYDLVRPGLGIYGGNPHPGQPSPFQAVATVEAQVIQLRSLDPGETVGYSATWTAKRPTRVATLAIGYADGYFTRFSNSGVVALAGALCPVIGRVSMDLVTVDVTAASRASVGDWAIVLGGPLPLEHSAELAGLNQYELLTSLGGRFERRYGRQA